MQPPAPAQPTLKASHLLFAFSLLVLGMEAFYLSQKYDAYYLIQSGKAGGWTVIFGYFGVLVRWLLTFSFVAFILFYREISQFFSFLDDTFQIRSAIIFGCLQIAAFAGLLWTSAGLFSPTVEGETSSRVGLLWLILAVSCAIFWIAMWFRPQRLWLWAQDNAWRLTAAGLIASAVTVFALATNSLWGPLAKSTFYLSAYTLLIVNLGEVTISEEQRILGLNDFWVNIAPACSGYEGMGLVAAFTAIYLYSHRNDMRFPRSFLLFPLGLASIWLMNVIRIAVLLMIGAFWSPEIAVGGFHSFGGWITFLLVSLGVLKLSSRSRWFSKIAADPKQEPTEMNTAAATVVPLITLLATTIVTSALTADFVWLYPLRVLAVGISLMLLWRYFQWSKYTVNAQPFLVGAGIALLWYALVPADPAYNQEFTTALQSEPALWQYLWLLFRFLGAVVTVPLAEELAFRGYLLCRISGSKVDLSGPILFNTIAFAVSSVAFGLLHGHWLAGILAGMAYAWLRLREQHIIAAIIAHAVTNLILFAAAALTGKWILI